jgi:hypothetical protein
MTFPNCSSYNLRSREKSRQSAQRSTARDGAEETKADVKAPEHPLLPLTLKLMGLVSQPAMLLAALVRDCRERTSKEVFWAKAAAFQQTELLGLCNAWRRVIEDIDHFDLSPTDTMMLKATLYYWRLWQHVCAACVDAVAAVDEAATEPVQQEKPVAWLPQKRPAASISPSLEDKSSDALTQGMVLSGSGLSKRSRITKTSNEFLVAWFLAHKDNPYPSPDERSHIATKTGLQEQQVRNWFANMRKRHWKPNRANAKKPRCLLDYVLRQTEA